MQVYSWYLLARFFQGDMVTIANKTFFRFEKEGYIIFEWQQESSQPN